MQKALANDTPKPEAKVQSVAESQFNENRDLIKIAVRRTQKVLNPFLISVSAISVLQRQQSCRNGASATMAFNTHGDPLTAIVFQCNRSWIQLKLE